MILPQILEAKAREVAEACAPRASLEEALRKPGLGVIGEIKRASPSRGAFAPHADPAAQLHLYEEGGAAAVSVVTDRTFFHGDPETLRALRPRTSLPLLRKDFLIHPLQVYESRLLGADAVLLLACALDQRSLRELLDLARSLGMEVLVEVHDEEELRRVLDTSARVLGVNNRDLRDFSVDLTTTRRLAEALDRLGGKDRVLVSESGVRSPEDAEKLARWGADGILVGEALMTDPDPTELLRRLRAAGGTP